MVEEWWQVTGGLSISKKKDPGGKTRPDAEERLTSLV